MIADQSEQMIRLGLTASDWIAIIAMVGGAVVPVCGLLWRISTRLALLAQSLERLAVDHAETKRRVDKIEPRVQRLALRSEIEREGHGGLAGAGGDA